MNILEFGFRNFNSYGNDWVIFNFRNNNSSLNLISGKNGTGKSTISQALTFSIYGKVNGKNIPSLINRHNDHLETFVILHTNSNDILKIERGLSPNYFKVYINDTLYDKAGKLSLQKIIEDEYLGISLDVFSNVISLSIDKFKSFIHLKKTDKLEITDKICNTSHFNVLDKTNKIKIKDLKKTIQNYESSKRTYENEILNIDEKINNIEISNESKNEIELLEDDVKLYNIKLNNIKTDINLCKEKLIKLNNDLNVLKVDIKELNNKYKLFKKGFCTTCGTKHDISNEELINIKTQLDTSKDNKLKKDIKVKDLTSNSKQLEFLYNDIVSKINKNNTKIELLKANNNTKIELLIEQRQEYIDNIKNLDSIIIEHNSDLNEYLLISDLLSETGLKHQIMKNISPIITNESNKILKRLKMKYTILWDEFSNIKLFENYIEIDPSTLSSGETKKVDFSILIALIIVLKINYPNINYLSIDEIFSSIDINSIDTLIEIVHEIISKLKLNCFITHHSQLQLSMFDNIYNTTKLKGYSKLTLE